MPQVTMDRDGGLVRAPRRCDHRVSGGTDARSPVEAGRDRLMARLASPWARRALVARRLPQGRGTLGGTPFGAGTAPPGAAGTAPSHAADVS